MSVTKPGVSSRVPPIAISRPSATSRPGKRRSASGGVEAAPGAAALVAQQQRAEHGVGEQQRERRPDADQRADLDDHVELDDRDDDEEDDEDGHR